MPLTFFPDRRGVSMLWVGLGCVMQGRAERKLPIKGR